MRNASTTDAISTTRSHDVYLHVETIAKHLHFSHILLHACIVYSYLCGSVKLDFCIQRHSLCHRRRRTAQLTCYCPYARSHVSPVPSSFTVHEHRHAGSVAEQGLCYNYTHAHNSKRKDESGNGMVVKYIGMLCTQSLQRILIGEKRLRILQPLPKAVCLWTKVINYNLDSIYACFNISGCSRTRNSQMTATELIKHHKV